MEFLSIESCLNLQVVVELTNEVGETKSNALSSRELFEKTRRYKDVATIPLKNLKDFSKFMRMHLNKLLETVPDENINHFNRATKIKSFKTITDKESLSYISFNLSTRVIDTEGNYFDYLFVSNHNTPSVFRASNYRMFYFGKNNFSRVITYSKAHTERSVHLNAFEVDAYFEVHTVANKTHKLDLNNSDMSLNTFEIIQEGFRNDFISSISFYLKDVTNSITFRVNISDSGVSVEFV